MFWARVVVGKRVFASLRGHVVLSLDRTFIEPLLAGFDAGLPHDFVASDGRIQDTAAMTFRAGLIKYRSPIRTDRSDHEKGSNRNKTHNGRFHRCHPLNIVTFTERTQLPVRR